MGLGVLDRGNPLACGGGHDVGDALGVVPLPVGSIEILLRPSTYMSRVKAQNLQIGWRWCSGSVSLLEGATLVLWRGGLGFGIGGGPSGYLQ